MWARIPPGSGPSVASRSSAPWGDLKFEERNQATTSCLPETPFHPNFAQSLSLSGQAASTERLTCAGVPGGFRDEVPAPVHGPPALAEQPPVPAFPPAPSPTPPARGPFRGLWPPQSNPFTPTVFPPGLRPGSVLPQHPGGDAEGLTESRASSGSGAPMASTAAPLWTPHVALSGRPLALAPSARPRPSVLEGLQAPALSCSVYCRQ